MYTPAIQELLAAFQGLLKIFPALIIGFAVLYFFWRLVQLLLSQKPEQRKDLKNLIMFGVLALFVMMFVWGIISLLREAFFPGAIIRQIGS